MHRGDRHGDSENLSGGLARIADDGVHECRGFKSVPFNLQQCVFPAACHAYIRHEHILHGIVQSQSLVSGHDALAGTTYVVTFNQSGDNGRTGGGCADAYVADSLARLLIGDILAARFHCGKEGGLGVQRARHGLPLRQPVPRHRRGVTN